MFGANWNTKTIGKEGGYLFTFTPKRCQGEREGQEADFEQLFDMFPTGTLHINYNEETGDGEYLLDGAMVQESDTIRLRRVKEVYDLQVDLVEADNQS